MGIFIYVDISKAVTQEEWEKVYEETLTLVNEFPMAETARVKLKGVETYCLIRTEERINKDKYSEASKKGWAVSGDYESMVRAECNYTPRELVDSRQYDPSAGDAIISSLPNCLDYAWDDKRFQNTYGIWGNKTQGYSFHMYLLAIACLIEDRLGDKAFVYGDITKGQCEVAVKMANEVLEKKIDMPARCYADRLFERLNKLNISEAEKFTAFEFFYLSEMDGQYGGFIREHFSKETLNEYWKKEFGELDVNVRGYDNRFSDFLTLGFALEDLCEYTKFVDKDGNSHYEDFVTRVMDAKLHIKEKDCSDPLKINQNSPNTYGIETLWAQFVFGAARNLKVDRFIPIEEIRETLVRKIGDKCDVNRIIDKYLQKEANEKKINLKNKDISDEELQEALNQDKSETFKQVMNNKIENIKEEKEKYDISDLEDAKYFEKGDSMPDKMMEAIGKSRLFLDGMLEEDDYRELSEKTAKEKKEWIAKHNEFLVVRDKDWKHIYGKLEKDKKAFGRYYSIMRADMSSTQLNHMGVAFLINDDFWNYSGELAEKYA